MSIVSSLSNQISLIDGFDLNRPNRTGTYVIHDNPITLIETSASPSIPYVLKGLTELNINPADVAYIIVTHIHLDHAGGVGLLLTHCPNATVIVHPKGARHLEDPSRLINSAKAVYGEQFDELFDPILPVPVEKLLIKNHLETLQLDNRTLTFYDTPGHANHHLSIYDSASKGVFAGDTAGFYYQELAKDGVEWYMPSTSPTQFNPEAMNAALDLYKEIGVENIYFGHYGASQNPEEVYRQVKAWLPIFIDAAKKAYQEYDNFDDQVKATAKSLYDETVNLLAKQNIQANHPVFEILELDFQVSAQGLIDYLIKLNK